MDLITALGCLLRRCRTKIPNHMLEMSELKCYAHIAQITHIKQLNILQREEEKNLRLNKTLHTLTNYTHPTYYTYCTHCKHYTHCKGGKNLNIWTDVGTTWVQNRNLLTKMHIRTCGRIFSTRNISLELQQNLPDLLQDLILDVLWMLLVWMN